MALGNILDLSINKDKYTIDMDKVLNSDDIPGKVDAIFYILSELHLSIPKVTVNDILDPFVTPLSEPEVNDEKI